MRRMFPILRDYRDRSRTAPSEIPWSVFVGREYRTHLNHNQTLEQLAQRGGLDPQEAWCVAHDRHWRDRCDYDEAVEWLWSLITAECLFVRTDGSKFHLRIETHRRIYQTYDPATERLNPETLAVSTFRRRDYAYDPDFVGPLESDWEWWEDGNLIRPEAPHRVMRVYVEGDDNPWGSK